MLNYGQKNKNIRTLVLSEKKILNETKNRNPPLKLNGRTLREKRQAKKEFRRAARIEIAKLRNEEKENILETRTKDTEMFHKLVRIR